MNFLRQMVSGPKKRFVEDGYNLDLTYVCPRLIAMSFPASGLETLYRNNIDNVSKMIKKKHNSDYLIINLSGRKYDYSKFQDKVLDYEWEDHHSPPINTLFIICEKIHQFLKKKKENVAIIHCLAGKGRTGTIICCYMLYTGRFETPQEALLYYGKKRFLQEGLGVNQPCQIRYVYYFHQILTERNVYPTLKYIKQVEMIGRPRISDDGCRPFIELINVHSQEKIFSTMKSHSEQAKFVENEHFVIQFEQSQPISGDILMRVKNNGAISNKNMIRVSFNTAFIKTDNVLEFGLSELSPSQILKDERFPKQFILRIVFGDFCKCNCYTPFEKKCTGCILELDKETQAWSTIYNIIANYKTPSPQEQKDLLFGQEHEDVDEILNREKKTFIEAKGILQKGKSSEENRERLSNFNEYMFKQIYNNEGEPYIEDNNQIKDMCQQQEDSGSDDGYTILKGDNPNFHPNQDQMKLNEKDQQEQGHRKRSYMQPNIYDSDQYNTPANHSMLPQTIGIINQGSTFQTCSSNSMANEINHPVHNQELQQIGQDKGNVQEMSQNIKSLENQVEESNSDKDKQNLIDYVQKQGQDIQMFEKEEEKPSHIVNNKSKNI